MIAAWFAGLWAKLGVWLALALAGGGVIEGWAETKPLRFTPAQWSEAGIE
jgi:hypothetical protein